MGHAAPAAGVLCSALVGLKPALHQNQPRTVAGMTLSRSSIIQQLTLLVRFLDWIGPAQPNNDLAKSVKGTIKDILDFALNGESATGIFPLTSMNDTIAFDLLDTFDSLRGFGGG